MMEHQEDLETKISTFDKPEDIKKAEDWYYDHYCSRAPYDKNIPGGLGTPGIAFAFLRDYRSYEIADHNARLRFARDNPHLAHLVFHSVTPTNI